MTTLQDSLLKGRCEDPRLAGYIEDCQHVLRSFSETEVLELWERITYMLHLWRGTAGPFEDRFRGVDTENDAQVLSRLIRLRKFPIGDIASPGTLLALGTLVRAREGDITGALLLLVNFMEEKMRQSSEEITAHAKDSLEIMEQQVAALKKIAPDWKLGKQQRAKVKRFHEKIHGTPDEKKTLWATYQADADKLRAAHPDWPKSEIYRRVGAKHKKNPKTIERHTEIPERKK